MTPRTEEGPLPRLDALLRRAGDWLLVGYTVVMVLVTFVVPDRPARDAGAVTDDVVLEVPLG